MTLELGAARRATRTPPPAAPRREPRRSRRLRCAVRARARVRVAAAAGDASRKARLEAATEKLPIAVVVDDALRALEVRKARSTRSRREVVLLSLARASFVVATRARARTRED